MLLSKTGFLPHATTDKDTICFTLSVHNVMCFIQVIVKRLMLC